MKTTRLLALLAVAVLVLQGCHWHHRHGGRHHHYYSSGHHYYSGHRSSIQLRDIIPHVDIIIR